MSKEADGIVLTDAERASYAERRHLFWRTRCLEHARKVDVLDKRCMELERALMEVINWKGCLNSDPDWNKELMRAISRAEVVVDCPLVFVPD